MSNKTITLGISACLYGQSIRYDSSRAKVPSILKKMFDDYAFQAFCPEVEAGMGVPREAVRLVKDDNTFKIIGSNSQKDWSKQLDQSIKAIISRVQKNRLRGYILKSKSPSCALSSAKIYNFLGIPQSSGAGYFTQALHDQVHIPLIEAEMLNCPRMADKFIRLTWLADDFYQLESQLSRHALTSLYARYKLSLMAFSPYHYQLAGQLLGNMNGSNLRQIKDDLYLIMYDGFNCLSSRKRQTNALMHIQGYFKKILNKSEKEELTQLIQNYSQGLVPLSVPLTLIKHYLLIYPQTYLSQQNYIEHPLEHYGLRNNL